MAIDRAVLRRRCGEVILVVAGAVLLVIAVAVDRSPTVFSDSDDYYELGLQVVTDIGNALHGRPVMAPPASDPDDADDASTAAQAAADAVQERHIAHSQMASRSVAYGVPLYVLDTLGSLWLVTAAQALAAAWLVRSLWRVCVPQAPRWHYLAAMAVLAAGTSLPFFAGFAMPDIFAGFAVLATAMLTLHWQALTRWRRWMMGALLAYAFAVHMSHLLTGLVLLALSLVLLLRLGRVRTGRSEIAAVAGALVAAWLVNAACARIDQWITGEPPGRQPFLTARVLADGPGRVYLRRVCADANPFVLCRFAHSALLNSDEILWSYDAGKGVFLLSDYATRLALEREEPRFVLAVIADDPVAVVTAALRNWALQLGEYQVEEPVRDPEFFLNDDYWQDSNLPTMIERVADCGEDGDQCAPRMTPAVSIVWHGTVLAASLMIIAVGFWRRRRGTPSPHHLYAAAALMVAGVVLNAAICGILSGPFPRYEARLVWLIPLTAMLMLSAWRSVAVAGRAMSSNIASGNGEPVPGRA